MIDETEKDALFPNGKTTDSTNSDDFDKLLEEFIRELKLPKIFVMLRGF